MCTHSRLVGSCYAVLTVLVLLVDSFVGIDGSFDGDGDGVASRARKLRRLDFALVKHWWARFVLTKVSPDLRIITHVC